MATISDVAKAAGVSSSTVSYVLSGKRPISAETRDRVEKAIADLGYRPNALARALASNRTQVLALAAPLRADVVVSVIMQFVAGIVTRARHYRWDVLLLTQDDSAGIDRISSESMVDAFIMMDIEADDPRIPMLVELRQPSVLIGLPKDPRGLSVVDLDFQAAGRLALRHLLDLGHTKIALIGPTPTVLVRHTGYADRMLLGYRLEAEQAGIDEVIELSEGNFAGGSQAVDRAFGRVEGLTALVVHNEAALQGVLAGLRAHGRSIPDDVSVIALCPADVARSNSIQLTSIVIPATSIGEIAVDLTMQRIQGDGAPETRLIVPEVTPGQSTVRPPA